MKKMQSPSKIFSDSLRKSDIDLRDELSKNIFLSGGGSMFPGIASRVQDEVQMLIPPEARALVRAERHRKYGAFIENVQKIWNETFKH